MSSKIFAKANKVQFQDQQLDDYVLEVTLSQFIFNTLNYSCLLRK